MGAARICGTQIFRYLLERDPQINVALLNDPLRSAAMAGSEEMVGLLLRHGANPNTTEMNPARPRYALTPLEAALWGRHLDIARQLIAAGAKPDIFEAAALGEARWLRAFLRKDPQLANLTDRMGLLPIDWACRARQKEAARVLLEYMDSPELSAMIAAGDEHRVRDYLDRVPIVIRTPDERRRYPLNYAIESGELGIAKLLLERGADVNAGRPFQSAIYDAVLQGDIEAVKLLIDHHADVRSARGVGGMLNLYQLAVRNNHPEIAELIKQAE